MRKWLWLTVLAVTVLLGYVAAGPYLALRAISDAVRAENASALSKQIDFPPLRDSLKHQLRDAMLRQAGDELQSSMFGGLGMALAGGVSDLAVDALVTPIGIGGLMEGRKSWNRVSGTAPPTRNDASQRPDPLAEARHRFESTSRFTATVDSTDGQPIIFVLTRSGLRWKLSDIRLPM